MKLLLIDADVFAYKAAAGAEKVICFEEDSCFPVCSLAEAKDAFYSLLTPILEYFDVSLTDCLFCFSVNSSSGFRRRLVLDTYKANREGKPRPVALKFLREALMKELKNVAIVPGLEADDVIGINATLKEDGVEKIIVSIDKDFKTIPCKLFLANHPEQGVHENTEEYADYCFLKQALTGDPTDGYKGCPKIGEITADKLLKENCSWKTVKAAYEKAGLTEQDALQQARCARILRATDYDFEKKEVILWEPPK